VREDFRRANLGIFSMKKYDDIIVGSGISGLTAALMLAQNGRKVLLIEKSSAIGGSMSRFYKKNIPFDVGFHFTGALSKNEILNSMLSVLGIKDSIKSFLIDGYKANSIVFEKSMSNKNKSGHVKFDIPSGIQNFRVELKKRFQDETNAIDSYMDFIQKVYDETVTIDLKNINRLTTRIEEDYITLYEVLNKLTDNKYLKCILASYCLCHGTQPSEISYANHARICAAFYESIARVVNGGSAFVDAFKDQFLHLNIDVCVNTYIDKFTNVNKKQANECVLNTGETVFADNYIFAIHPREILKVLPHENLRRNFVDSINDFEPSIGFFSLYCVLDDINSDIDFVPGITTLYADNNLNVMCGNSDPSSKALTILRNVEIDKNSKKSFTLNILETSCVEDVTAWTESRHGDRPSDYYLYKKDREKKIIERVFKTYPEYKKSLKVLGSASILTYKDYLNSYDGTAYGIKQKIGQFNLFGRLPFRNIYAIGQSSILPGVIGAMISSFMVGRVLLGNEAYNRYIDRRTDN